MSKRLRKMIKLPPDVAPIAHHAQLTIFPHLAMWFPEKNKNHIKRHQLSDKMRCQLDIRNSHSEKLHIARFVL